MQNPVTPPLTAPSNNVFTSGACHRLLLYPGHTRNQPAQVEASTEELQHTQHHDEKCGDGDDRRSVLGESRRQRSDTHPHRQQCDQESGVEDRGMHDQSPARAHRGCEERREQQCATGLSNASTPPAKAAIKPTSTLVAFRGGQFVERVDEHLGRLGTRDGLSARMNDGVE